MSLKQDKTKPNWNATQTRSKKFQKKWNAPRTRSNKFPKNDFFEILFTLFNLCFTFITFFDFLRAILAPRGRSRGQPPKKGDHFPQNVPKSLVFTSQNEPPGILVRIFRIYSDLPETQHAVRNRPWVSHAGGQDYGSLHLSLIHI